MTEQEAKIFEEHFNKNKFLNQKDLFNFLYSDKQKRRVKSVIKPPAQTTTSCYPGKQDYVYINSLLSKIDKLKMLDLKLYYIAQIQFEQGLRISEVLNLRVYDLMPSGHFYIKSAKGSNNRVYFVASVANYFITCKKNGVDPFANYNRFFVYRQYKKLGIDFYNSKTCKHSVTHAFRHIIANEIYKNVDDTETVSDFLRHKNKENYKYYVDNKTYKK